MSQLSVNLISQQTNNNNNNRAEPELQVSSVVRVSEKMAFEVAMEFYDQGSDSRVIPKKPTGLLGKTHWKKTSKNPHQT